MKIEIEDNFPLSKNKSVNGSRRLAREKVLQILNAFEVSETPWPQLFPHIFGRKFNFDDDNQHAIKTPPKADEQAIKYLKPDEVYELEADLPINWLEDDIKFATRLIELSIEHRADYDKIIDEHAQNWDVDRLALIDKILIYMAATELTFFPEIPVRVTMNEAIDIAKKYSTDKSGAFLNGLLEAFINILRDKGALNKIEPEKKYKKDRFTHSDLIE